jgi:hypothetical protein
MYNFNPFKGMPTDDPLFSLGKDGDDPRDQTYQPLKTIDKNISQRIQKDMPRRYSNESPTGCSNSQNLQASRAELLSKPLEALSGHDNDLEREVVESTTGKKRVRFASDDISSENIGPVPLNAPHAPLRLPKTHTTPSQDGTSTDWNHSRHPLQDNEENLRRSKRAKPPSSVPYYLEQQYLSNTEDWCNHIKVLASVIDGNVRITIPRTIPEALRSKYKEQWEKAIQSELKTIHENSTWTLVKAPEGAHILPSTWSFNIWYDENGLPIKFKARLCARGDRQLPGIEYDEAYSPVADFRTFRTLMAIAAKDDLELHQLDVKGAYLYGEMDTDIYMRQPPHRAVPGQEHLVCKLNKSLYGLVQAGRIWNSVLNKFLEENGFKRCKSDECFYIKMINGKPFYILAYVDDAIFAHHDIEAINDLKKAFAKRFKVHDLGELKTFIGIHVVRNRKKRQIHIHQKGYIDFVLQTFRQQNCDSRSIPEDTHTRLSIDMQPQTEEDYKKLLPNLVKLYQKANGALLYLSSKTRPDISHAVQQISQFAQNPGMVHWTAVMNVLKYLKRTPTHGILYDHTHCPDQEHPIRGNFTYGSTKPDKTPTKEELASELYGHADADWANEPVFRRSVGGFVFSLNGGIIDYACKRFHKTASSTLVAEWYAADAAAKNALAIRNFLIELNLLKKNSKGEIPAIPIFEDNNGCISFANNAIGRSKVKHLALKYHFLKDEVETGTLKLYKVSTDHNIADIFTKALPKPRFEYLRSAMNIVDVSTIVD